MVLRRQNVTEAPDSSPAKGNPWAPTKRKIHTHKIIKSLNIMDYGSNTLLFSPGSLETGNNHNITIMQDEYILADDVLME